MSRPTEGQPALTAEEWAGRIEPAPDEGMTGYTERAASSDVALRVFPHHDVAVMVVGLNGSAELQPRDRHALAALCLYNQPFGFTQEDLELLDADADHYHPNRSKKVASLRSRIASLLPPSETP